MPAEKLLHYREYDQRPARAIRRKVLTPGVRVQLRPARAHVGVLQRRGDGQPGQGGRAARLRRQPDGRRQRRGRAPGGRQAAERQGAGRRQQRHDRRPPAGVHGRLRPDPHAGRLRPADRDDHGRGPRCAVHRSVPRVLRPQAARAGHQAPDGPGHRRAPKAARRPTRCSKPEIAIKYLEKRGGYEKAIEMLKAAKPEQEPADLQGLAPASARIATTSARSSTRSSTA